jgi:hypothetical protein
VDVLGGSMRKYKVHVGWNRLGHNRFVYFASLESASKFCNEVFAKTKLVLEIIEV